MENQTNKSSLLFENQITWMNTREAAAYLRVSTTNLRNKIYAGIIPVHGKLGRTYRFRRDELDKVLGDSKRGSQ